MARAPYGGPLFWMQGKRISKVITDEELKKHYTDLYRHITYQIRKTYDLSKGMPNYMAQLLIDEIAITSIRIIDAEYQLLKAQQLGEVDHKWEETIRANKEQRGKTMERIIYLITGKRGGATQVKTGKMSYRDRMNRSRKLQQVQAIENNLEAIEQGEDRQEVPGYFPDMEDEENLGSENDTTQAGEGTETQPDGQGTETGAAGTQLAS